MNVILYKDIPVRYQDEGKGLVMVFLHGFLENLTMWDEIKKTFLSNYRVITIDLLGHGETGCLGYIHTMEMMAAEVEFVLNHLNIKKAVLIGHSMGGYVSLAYAQKNADKVKGIVLMNSTFKADSEEKKAGRERAIAAVKQNYKSFVRMSVINLFRPKNRTVFAEQLKVIKEEALKTPLQGIVAALEGMKIRDDKESLFKKGSFKKMMVIGKKDRALNYESLIKQIENTDIIAVVTPDGHMAHVENRMYFIEKLLDFIKLV